jgi:hypothetical protein
MIKTFTPDDLVRFLYNETSPRESEEIELALATDSNLQAEWQELADLTEDLDRLIVTPSEDVTQRILQAAHLFNMPALQN